MLKQDHHHAAQKGQRYERLVVNALKEMGADLKTSRQYTKILLPKCYQVTGKKNYYVADAYTPNWLGKPAYVEIKGASAVGTTDEKVFYDLEKFRDRVYGDKQLVYIFCGVLESTGKSHCADLLRLKAQKIPGLYVLDFSKFLDWCPNFNK